MNNVRTVSDTKRAFYSTHTRPINSIYRRVVEELMVEMHLLSVNASFKYDPIYAVGVVTSFDRFMLGYRPEEDLGSIFSALCGAIDADPSGYRQDAERLLADANQAALSDLKQFAESGEGLDSAGSLKEALHQVAAEDQFKYSRLWAIGLYNLIEAIDSEAAGDPEKLKEVLEPLCDRLGIAFEKLQKDLDIYRSNLEKLAQARILMEDILKADRKKRDERQAGTADASADTPPSGETSEETTEDAAQT
ncbi:MAG: photosystem II biogenesis protein Psp29 [Cyanobacteria bacterium P01_A01_bin.135]